MERVNVVFSDTRFDQVVHPPSLPEHGDLEFVVKDEATVEGSAGVAVTFTVNMPDGKRQRVQAVTTAKIMIALGDAIRAHVVGRSNRN